MGRVGEREKGRAGEIEKRRSDSIFPTA